MSVTNSYSPGSYTGNGVATVYAYGFKIADEDDLLVKVAGVTKTITTDYTVSGVDSETGGNVTFVVAPANGAAVTIERNVGYTRPTDYQRNGAFEEATVDDDFDRLEMQVQQLDDRMKRSAVLALPVSGVTTPIALPPPGAGKFLRWNNAGTALETIAASPDDDTFTQSGTGAVARSWSAKVGEIMSVTDFGASPAASAVTNLAAFKLAVAAIVVGGALFVPAGATPFSIDTSGGLTQAIEVNKRMTVYLEGDVKATFGAIQANPPSVFYVTGDGVTFTGTGTLKGDGTVNQVNTGTDATIPSLVRVTGDFFTMHGLTIDTPYKTGVILSGSYGSKIVGNNFTGGPTAYADTAYFGVRMYQGGRHIVANNQFYPDGGGGMYVQCIFSDNANECVIEGNVAYRPYEKLAYIVSSNNLVCGNVIVGNTGTIPGTNTKGTVGVAIRVDGNYNKVTNNYTIHGGGCSSLGGTGNDISNNTFLNCGQGGIAVFGGSAVFDYTTIRNNTITCGNLAGVSIANGILLDAPTGTNRYIDISGNTVTGFSQTDPIANIAAWTLNTVMPTVSTVKPTVPNNRIYTCTTGGTTAGVEPTWPTTPGNTVVDGTVTWTCVAVDSTTNAQIKVVAPGGGQLIDRSTISRNNVASGRIGISTTYADNCTIEDNRILASVYGITEINGTNNIYRFNSTEGGAPTTVNGISASSLDINYKEGTFTPVLSDGTDDATMGGAGSNNAKWVRIGNLVTFSGNIATTALGSVNGNIRIKGLPYAAGSGAAKNSAVTFGAGVNFAITAGQSVAGFIESGTDYIQLNLWDAITGTTAMQDTEWSADGSATFSGSYFV